MKNYPKTCFDKSEADKMKKICSNQVLEPTFSKHVLEIDVDSIEKFIHCSLQGGPFGGPACPSAVQIAREKKDYLSIQVLPPYKSNGRASRAPEGASL